MNVITEQENNLVTTLHGNPAKTPSTSFSTKQKGEGRIDFFIGVMQSIYPNWLSWIKTPNQMKILRAEWSSVLDKLSKEEIRLGVEECKVRDVFPPSIARFIRLALGIKEFDEAKDGDEFKKKAREVAGGDYAYRMTSPKEFDKLFRNAYAKVVSQYLEKRMLDKTEKKDELDKKLLEQKQEVLKFEAKQSELDQKSTVQIFHEKARTFADIAQNLDSLKNVH